MKCILTVCQIFFVSILFALQPAPSTACSEVVDYINWPNDTATNVPTNTYFVTVPSGTVGLTDADITATLTDTAGNIYSLTTTIADEYFGENTVSFLPTDGDLPADTGFVFNVVFPSNVEKEINFTTASGPDEDAPVIEEANVTNINYHAAGESGCGPFDEYIHLSIDWTYAEDDFANTFMRYSSSDPLEYENIWGGAPLYDVEDFGSSANVMLQARDYSGNESGRHWNTIDLTQADTTQDSITETAVELPLFDVILCAGTTGTDEDGCGPAENNADGAASCSLSTNATSQSLVGLMVVGTLSIAICLVRRQSI